MNEEKQNKLVLMNQAKYNASALMNAHDLLEKYDLSDYTGAKEFVLHTLEVATDEQNDLAKNLHKEIWPENNVFSEDSNSPQGKVR